MKDQILTLRNQGLSYNEIAERLNCSKGTISYHCGTGQKDKTAERQRRNRQTSEGNLSKRLSAFKLKVRNYKRRNLEYFDVDDLNRFTVDEALIKIGIPICYLTGRSIDLLDRTSYHLDHIIPVSRNGDNSLDNLGLLCKEANFAKYNMTPEEFINLCKEVLIHKGYSITMNN